MDFISTVFEDWPYLSWALSAAALFYTATAFATSHMHQDKRAALALWLQGDYESTWTEQFCRTFDGAFGEKHLSLRCFLASSIASLIAVLALWLLFDQILGLISLRADSGLTLTQALLLGAAINLVPDYLSLYQTRRLLQFFERVRNPLGQFALLLADAVVTGLIIFGSVRAYLWLTGQDQIALMEMVALFSLYSVFFYSTFLTSMWAWAYCASSWFVRMSSGLQDWLNVAGAPGKTLAFLGAALVFIGSMALQPVLRMDENGRTVFDTTLCDVSGKVCQHHARMTEDEEQILDLLARACVGGVTEECLDAGLKLHEIRPDQAVKLWDKSCANGDARSCTNLGLMYETARGVARNEIRASELFRQACEGGDARGCTNLVVMYQTRGGVMQYNARAVQVLQQACDGGSHADCHSLGLLYQNALGVARNDARAAELYRQACKGGNLPGCTSLGLMYQDALGVAANNTRAYELFRHACDGGEGEGCSALAWMYQNALGVARNDARAFELYRQSCERGAAVGCTNLGVIYQNALGVARNDARSIELYRKACEGGDARGCTYLGHMYKDALAVEFYRRGCEGGDALGCTYLAWMYEYGLGVDQNDARAVHLYRKACQWGEAAGCSSLGWLFETGRGVERDADRVMELYTQACELRGDEECLELQRFQRPAD